MQTYHVRDDERFNFEMIHCAFFGVLFTLVQMWTKDISTYVAILLFPAYRIPHIE